MSYDTYSETLNPQIRRSCFLVRKAARRRLKAELESEEKRFQKESKAFTQKMLLYLAQGSQRRHEREARMARLTKMFSVSLDESEMQMAVGFFNKKDNEDGESNKGKKKGKKPSKGDEIKKQKLDLGHTFASESSEPSDREESQTPMSLDSSQRVRALSMDVLQEVTDSDKRRLSAPDVVITPIIKRTYNSFSSGSSKENDKEGLVPPRMTPQTSEIEDSSVTPHRETPSSETFSARQPQEKSDMFLTRVSSMKSTIKTYPRDSPFLLKRVGSHDSSTIGKKFSKQELLHSLEEITNPVQDQRFLDLLSNLCILPGHEETLENSHQIQKRQPPKEIQ